jgi:hypothetical protein
MITIAICHRPLFADTSYARCVKAEKLSNGKYKGQGNKKNGNKYLAWAFMEAAHYGRHLESTDQTLLPA